MSNNQMKDQSNSGKGTYTATGFKVAAAPKNDNYKNYCFKCGQPKSAHGIFGKCPK